MNHSRCGLLYTLSSQLIATVRYEEIGDAILLHILDQKESSIPDEAFLVTKDPNETSKSFCIALSWDTYPEDDEGQGPPKDRVLTGRRRKPASCANVRGDLRVPVDMEIWVESPALEKPVKAVVKNVSAGGVLFVCEAPFSRGESVSFSLPLPGRSLQLMALIVNKIPTTKENVWGYGCSLMDLDTAKESKIRQFVFQEEVRHRRER